MLDVKKKWLVCRLYLPYHYRVLKVWKTLNFWEKKDKQTLIYDPPFGYLTRKKKLYKHLSLSTYQGKVAWMHKNDTAFFLWKDIFGCAFIPRFLANIARVGDGNIPLKIFATQASPILPFIICFCLTKTGNYQIHEFHRLKSILQDFPS